MIEVRKLDKNATFYVLGKKKMRGCDVDEAFARILGSIKGKLDDSLLFQVSKIDVPTNSIHDREQQDRLYVIKSQWVFSITRGMKRFVVGKQFCENQFISKPYMVRNNGGFIIMEYNDFSCLYGSMSFYGSSKLKNLRILNVFGFVNMFFIEAKKLFPREHPTLLMNYLDAMRNFIQHYKVNESNTRGRYNSVIVQSFHFINDLLISQGIDTTEVLNYLQIRRERDACDWIAVPNWIFYAMVKFRGRLENCVFCISSGSTTNSAPIGNFMDDVTEMVKFSLGNEDKNKLKSIIDDWFG